MEMALVILVMILMGMVLWMQWITVGLSLILVRNRLPSTPNAARPV